MRAGSLFEGTVSFTVTVGHANLKWDPARAAILQDLYMHTRTSRQPVNDVLIAIHEAIPEIVHAWPQDSDS